MNTVSSYAAAAMAGILAASCLPEAAAPPFAIGDARPPAVASWGATGAYEIAVAFDEPIAEALPGFASSPGGEIASVRLGDDGRSVIVTVSEPLAPGASYAVSGSVADAAGNRSAFVLPYWGYNPEPPRLLLNELLTEGSSTRPDAVEFYVASGGQCAGLAFFVGVPGNYQLRYVFPPLRVEAGDYVVLHLKPLGLATELDESGDKAASGGADASPNAWDLWYRGGDGALSGKNGALSLCATPLGGYLDAVAYSERRVDSDSKYGGFGSAALRDRVAALVAAGAWRASEPPRPEDCARSTGTTSTRTICRSSTSADTDSGGDWRVVPTKGASLGSANTDEAYVP